MNLDNHIHAAARLGAALAATVALAGGCAWVKLEEGGSTIRVARAGENLSHCERAGEITVSVRDRVGFYERDDLTVRDELETLARNEAGSLRADTIPPLAPPQAGEQPFAGYRCGSRAAAPANAATVPANAATTPVPVREAPVAEPLPAEPARGTQGFEPIEDDG